ncbi:hypothetical protein NDU88_004784 [Pleurodeles waltl]|uniref:Uncharacterized protein n=1 Tax=Pleurodeles waltl TaxID=8319 RepID=A0AAV7SJV8_PLEWA|nr:hypothetical protein NDU88_004784 [Pleurodeles waltl]
MPDPKSASRARGPSSQFAVRRLGRSREQVIPLQCLQRPTRVAVYSYSGLPLCLFANTRQLNRLACQLPRPPRKTAPVGLDHLSSGTSCQALAAVLPSLPLAWLSLRPRALNHLSVRAHGPSRCTSPRILPGTAAAAVGPRTQLGHLLAQDSGYASWPCCSSTSSSLDDRCSSLVPLLQAAQWALRYIWPLSCLCHTFNGAHHVCVPPRTPVKCGGGGAEAQGPHRSMGLLSRRGSACGPSATLVWVPAQDCITRPPQLSATAASGPQEGQQASPLSRLQFRAPNQFFLRWPATDLREDAPTRRPF